MKRYFVNVTAWSLAVSGLIGGAIPVAMADSNCDQFVATIVAKIPDYREVGTYLLNHESELMQCRGSIPDSLYSTGAIMQISASSLYPEDPNKGVRLAVLLSRVEEALLEDFLS